MGLFMENGPCTILQKGGPVYNKYSWTSNASVFWVDQPVGVGFSYASYGESVVCNMFSCHERSVYLTISQSTTEEAAKDIAAFVAIFFQHFTQFQGRAFHMAGESYAVSLCNIGFVFEGTK